MEGNDGLVAQWLLWKWFGYDKVAVEGSNYGKKEGCCPSNLHFATSLAGCFVMAGDRLKGREDIAPPATSGKELVG